jgi:hypothetical protein
MARTSRSDLRVYPFTALLHPLGELRTRMDEYGSGRHGDTYALVIAEQWTRMAFFFADLDTLYHFLATCLCTAYGAHEPDAAGMAVHAELSVLFGRQIPTARQLAKHNQDREETLWIGTTDDLLDEPDFDLVQSWIDQLEEDDAPEDIDPDHLTPQQAADCRAWVVAGGATSV